MADETDSDEEAADKATADSATDDVQANAESEAEAGSESTPESEENDDGDEVAGNAGADNSGEGDVRSNVVPIDVFEPLGRYQSYLKVLTTCVTELADAASESIGSYLRRPDGYFYAGLSDEMVAYLVELFYGGAVDTLSTDAASPGCLSEMRMRKTIGEFFSQAVSMQLADESNKALDDVVASQSTMTAVGEQELIKQQYSRSMLAVMMMLESDGLKCELETGFCINLLEKVLGVSFSSSEPVAISDARWSNELRKSVVDCDLELRCTMAELPVRLGDVQKFKVGDFIPLADLDSVLFSINRRKLFQGQFGVVDDKPSASFKRWI